VSCVVLWAPHATSVWVGGQPAAAVAEQLTSP